MGIMLRMRTLPAGFIAPCLPTKTDKAQNEEPGRAGGDGEAEEDWAR